MMGLEGENEVRTLVMEIRKEGYKYGHWKMKQCVMKMKVK